jgi:hypothetical protein
MTWLAIAASDLMAAGGKNASQAAHADAADTNKMNPEARSGLVKSKQKAVTPMKIPTQAKLL